ncbi:MAG: ribosome biogenesis GTP-binding protein YihA/YsxC [Clostridia bacterium]|nr:ribosome biogenesis GTP-binding protein YihA/YsxC [Clostridia bacterium]
MVIKNAKYELTAVKPEQYPVNTIPEVAFVGRSNVGKSSIINSLLNRKNLARVGATPGKTQQINFYNLDDMLYFVDLPGYGYASVSKEKKASWGKIIETYLNTRSQLKLIVMLVDIRHTPTKDDQLMHEWIRSRNIPYMVVATKSDKISRSQIIGRISDISKTLHLQEGIKPLPYSAEKKQGVEQVWETIDGYVGEGGDAPEPV